MDILKTFGIEGAKASKTPMSTTTKLSKDETGKPVDKKHYKSMIESFFI